MGSTLQFWQSLPKAELHVHLEAGVPLSFYQALPQWPPLPPGLFKAPATFQPFLNTWFSFLNTLSTPDIIFEMARQFVHHQYQQNIFYTEAYISPLDVTWLRRVMPHFPPPLPLTPVLEAYSQGVAQGEQELRGKATVGLIVDALWVSPPTVKSDLLMAIERVLEKGPRHEDGKPVIIGLGLGGPEVCADLKGLSLFCQRAKDMGLHLDIHSGETAPCETARESCHWLQPHRVAHGIAPFKEGLPPQDILGEVPLCMCPTSNAHTGAWHPDKGPHPLRRALEGQYGTLGPVTLNSDDPLIFETTLALEYEKNGPKGGTPQAQIFYETCLKNSYLSAFDKGAWERVMGRCGMDNGASLVEAIHEHQTLNGI